MAITFEALRSSHLHEFREDARPPLIIGGAVNLEMLENECRQAGHEATVVELGAEAIWATLADTDN